MMHFGLFLVMRAIIPLLLLLSACAEPPWLRMDGQPISSSQLKIDISHCRDEVAKIETPKGIQGVAIVEAFEGDMMRRCMARRGYFQAR
jgi:hypothetical protein